MSQLPKVAVFDIGGVLVQICQTWQEAVAVAGLTSSLPAEPPVPLTGFPAFNAFQATDISAEEYLRDLAPFLGIPADRAIDVHAGILRKPYPGIERVIEGLESARVLTGCLSNTNAHHWAELTETPRFNVISRLDYRAGSHELGYAKPDPRAFEAYIELFGLQDSDVIFFDDSAANVEAARRFGWRSFVIDPSADPPAQIEAAVREWRVVSD